MTRGMGGKEEKLEKQIEKQMGCMAGFLHIFDRNHIFASKRIYSVKRLPPSTPPETHSSPEPDTRGGSPAESAPDTETETEKTQPEKTPLPLPVFDFKEGTRSSWKFAREAPRLSLDSRAVANAKGTIQPREGEKRRRSTSSVVAKLMGLEEEDSAPELRRSASESRVPRDLPQQQYRFFDTTNFQLRHHHHVDSGGSSFNDRASDPNAKAEPVRGMIRQRKSFYDSADFFPGPKQSSVSVSVHGEIERRLKLRGIDEPSKDLDTLKQILDALQLKGLLHSKKSTPSMSQRNLVFENNVNHSPIVVMKPATRSSGSLNRTGWTGNDSPPASSLRARPETDRNARAQSQQARGRNTSSPTRSPNRVRKATNVETQRKVNDVVVDRRRVAPVHSPKVNSRNGLDRQSPSRSPRTRKATSYQREEKAMPMVEDESSTVSESSFSTSSHTDTERFFKVEDQYREGKNLLQRCDKLLNSIAEITGGAELQPSPVSVLDSSFYRDDSSCSPSPVMKRCIDYKDQGAESEDEAWSAALCCSEAKSEDSDFMYVSEILRAANYLPEDSDVFLLLEQQQYLKGNDTSKVSTLQRRLIFDIIHEILNRNRRLPPWRVENAPPLHRIWSEFRRIRERVESEDLFEVICGVLRKDMAGDITVNEWGECPVEMGDVVLDMERLIFKDLVGETIRDLASFKGQPNKVTALRRKLVFEN